MSEHKIHIGHTELVIESRFGVHVLSVGENGRPAQRVGTFDTAVAASHAVEAIKQGLLAEGINWDERRLGSRPGREFRPEVGQSDDETTKGPQTGAEREEKNDE